MENDWLIFYGTQKPDVQLFDHFNIRNKSNKLKVEFLKYGGAEISYYSIFSI